MHKMVSHASSIKEAAPAARSVTGKWDGSVGFSMRLWYPLLLCFFLKEQV